jgi:hypothetical protein
MSYEFSSSDHASTPEVDPIAQSSSVPRLGVPGRAQAAAMEYSQPPATETVRILRPVAWSGDRPAPVAYTADRPSAPTSPPVIADQLQPFVDEATLCDNYVDALCEHQLGDGDAERVERIREGLLRIPLICAVESPEIAETICAEGLKPQAIINSRDSYTTPLDESLGLDQYVFTQWGELEDNGYGPVHIAVDPGLVLPGSIVTANDLLDIAHAPGIDCINKDFDLLPLPVQQRVRKEYFGTMLRGNDWLEIKARQILQHAKGPRGDSPYPLFHGLGEVKHLGPVPSSAILEVADATDPQDLERIKTNFTGSLLKLGLAPSSMTFEEKQQNRGVLRRIIEG